MNARVQQYLKSITKLGINKLKSEGRKLGLIIDPIKDRKKSIQKIQNLNPIVIEKYLKQRDDYKPRPSQHIDSVFQAFPKIPERLEHMLHQLKIIRQMYLNQYTKKLNMKQHRVSLSAFLFSINMQRSHINELMGVKQEIQLDPKNIKFDYHRRSSSLMIEVFPTYSNETYQILLKNIKSGFKFIDVNQAKAKLLQQYGVKKHLQFEEDSCDIFQELIYFSSTYTECKRKKLFSEIVKRKEYLTQFLSNIDESSSIKIIKEIQLYFTLIKQINYEAIQIVLRVCSILLSNSQVKSSIEQKTEQSLLITNWIIQQLKYFWTFYKQSGLSRQKLRKLFETIKQYQIVKQKLLNTDLPVTIRTSLQIIQQLQEHQKIFKDCEQIGIGVGINDIGGSQISETFFIIKEIVNYADQQQLQFSPLMLEQIVLSFRNALQWYRQSQKTAKQQKINNQLFISNFLNHFDNKFCFYLINKLFISPKLNLQFLLVIQYFWSYLYNGCELQEQSIKSLLMMIRITIDYDYSFMFEQNDEISYGLLMGAIKSIKEKDITVLQTPEIIKLLEQSGIRLIKDSHKQLYLQALETIKSPKFDKFMQ